MTLVSRTAGLLLLLLGSTLLAGRAEPQSGEALVSVQDVSVERREALTTVQIRTSGTARYEASLFDRPPRLVIDLADAAFAWRRVPLRVAADPVREIRGSQHRPRVARIVIELVARTDYHIESGPQGLRVTFQQATASPQAPTGSPQTPATTGSPGRAAAAPTIVLYGIVHSDQGAVAYIEDPATKNVGRYRVGDTIAGATIEAIEPEHVILKGPAGPFELWLGDAKPAAPSPAPPTARPAPRRAQ